MECSSHLQHFGFTQSPTFGQSYCNVLKALEPSSLGSLTRVLLQEPGPIEYYICLCGNFGGVSEIQTSLDVSDLFKGHQELTCCSSLMHSYLFPLLDVLYRHVGNLTF